jgi:hypothetical protein
MKASLQISLPWLHLSRRHPLLTMQLGPPKPARKLKFGPLQLRVLSRSTLIQQSETLSQPKLLSAGIPKGLSSRPSLKFAPPYDPNFGEALVALLAAALATSLQLKNFTIEGDSLTIITALQHPSISHNWSIEKIISDSISILPASLNW